MYEEDPISKVITAFGIIGSIIMVCGIYVARTYHTLAGVGIIMAGVSLLILPMTRKRY